MLGLEALALCLDVDADVGEAVFGPAYGGAMQVREPSSLHLVPDDGDVLRELARELAEAGDGEEEVLERVERVVLGRRTARQGECVSVQQRRWARVGCLVGEVLGKPEVGFCLCRGGRLARLATGGRDYMR